MSCNVELIERTGDVDHGYSSPVMDSTALESSSEQHEFSLPPADTGKDAWLFLATCFLVEAVVWGMSYHMVQFSRSKTDRLRHRLSILIWYIPRLLWHS